VGSVAVAAVGVSKRYGDRDALCGVDLIARHGQLHGLLGPNGAGKTTLLRVLLGLVRRDCGSVTLLGRPLESTNGPLPDGVAGFVDTPAFYPYLSGRNALALLARLDGIGRSARDERIARALHDVSLTPHADEAVGGYSAGMRQRLGIAASLLRSPRLLFLDEPTSSLDPASAREVRTVASNLAKDGASIVWSSHHMSEVEDLCHTVTVLNRGRTIFSGTVDEIRALLPPAVHALSTSDDDAAIDLARRRAGLRVSAGAMGALEVSAAIDALDEYVVALGRAGIAVRALQRRNRTLESLFLELTGGAVIDAPDSTEPVAMAP